MSVLPSLNSIKVGIAIVVDNEPYMVMDASFMRTAQRKPVMRTKLKNLKTAKVREVSFKPGDTVEEAEVDKRKAQYLYQDDQFAYFMDAESFEQYSLSKEAVGKALEFLKEGTEVALIMFQGSMINVDPPAKVTLAITSTAPAVRGDTAGNVMKDATVETGATIKVPHFIQEGERVIISTATGEYSARDNE